MRLVVCIRFEWTFFFQGLLHLGKDSTTELYIPSPLVQTFKQTPILVCFSLTLDLLAWESEEDTSTIDHGDVPAQDLKSCSHVSQMSQQVSNEVSELPQFLPSPFLDENHLCFMSIFQISHKLFQLPYIN
jgi:hypothetical protein